MMFHCYRLTEIILADPTTKNATSVIIRADGTWNVEGGNGDQSSALNGTAGAVGSLGGQHMIIDVESDTTIFEPDFA